MQMEGSWVAQGEDKEVDKGIDPSWITFYVLELLQEIEENGGNEEGKERIENIFV